jgi:hypothetical protein
VRRAFFVTLNQMYFHAHKGGQFCILAHGRGVQESEVPSAKAYEVRSGLGLLLSDPKRAIVRVLRFRDSGNL